MSMWDIVSRARKMRDVCCKHGKYYITKIVEGVDESDFVYENFGDIVIVFKKSKYYLYLPYWDFQCMLTVGICKKCSDCNDQMILEFIKLANSLGKVQLVSSLAVGWFGSRIGALMSEKAKKIDTPDTKILSSRINALKKELF